VGTREYLIQLNSSPELVSAINNVPIKTVDGAPVYMRDVAQVRDGYSVQSNIVRDDGDDPHCSRFCGMAARLLSRWWRVKKLLPAIESTLPPRFTLRRCSTSRSSCALPSAE